MGLHMSLLSHLGELMVSVVHWYVVTIATGRVKRVSSVENIGILANFGQTGVSDHRYTVYYSQHSLETCAPRLHYVLSPLPSANPPTCRTS